MSDTARITEAEIQAIDTARLASVCNPPPPPMPSPLTREQAIENTRGMLRARAGADALTAVEAAFASTGSDALGKSAVRAVLAGNPAGALAAEITRAAAGDPAAARNAAALLPLFGMDAEALALGEAGVPDPASEPGPGGINNRAAALNAQGIALIHMHRWDEAEAKLREAVIADPTSTVAAANLAVAALCAGKEHRTEFIVGFWRRQLPFTSAPGGPPYVPDPDAALDMSHGQDGVLPTLFYPREADGAKDALVRSQKLDATSLSRQMARNSRRSKISPIMAERARVPLSGIWGQQIILVALSADEDPGVAAAKKAMEAKSGDGFLAGLISNFLAASPGKIIECSQPGGSPTCFRDWCGAELRARHSEWLSWQLQYDTLVRDYWKLWARRSSGAIANLSDMIVHEAAMLNFQDIADATYYARLRAPAKEWIDFVAVSNANFGCLEPPPPPPDAADSTPEARADRCPENIIDGMFGVAVHEVLEVTVNCERVSVEIAGEGLVRPFLSVDIERTGDLMLYIGSKGTVGTDFGPPTIGAELISGKSGLYVRVGSDGSIEDVGARVQFGEPEVKVGSFIGRSAVVESMDFSFVGIFR
ncbi:hypothetical protein E2C06_25460 [Dankookia rubra]|uniref:Tetratricopeptide repeat protein n=1 Tax=Dankookia rubra TaxID=1442381 RepID=A0A4R5Q9V0_9PROT|nr:tetratricopeptide repeat protein [Dankookia rubra]TDH59794.1 hypothetical protein E2C06_25460 [Dankookia rubra]